MKRTTRRRLVTVAAVAAGAALAATALLLLSGGGEPLARDRAAVRAYAGVVKELSFEGGRLLQQDVKPRITDLREGDVTPEQFRREADNWIRLYESLRQRFADALRPPRLDRAAQLYDSALVKYIDAFRAFRDASTLSTQQARNDAITAAVPLAEEADALFDRARDELERQMRSVGVTPPADL